MHRYDSELGDKHYISTYGLTYRIS